MDRAELARLYTTGEFANCMFISADGQEFNAHRFMLSQYPHLKALIDENNHIHLGESTEATERLLRWMYGLDNWKTDNIQPTKEGVGKELTEIMSLCDAAQKVWLDLTSTMPIDGIAWLTVGAVRHPEARRQHIQRRGPDSEPHHFC
jgi:hypothetical protein